MSFPALEGAGNPPGAGKLKPPVAGFRDGLPADAQAMLRQMRAVSAVGSPETVRADIEAFVARTRADELMITGSVFDQEARRRSLALTMKSLR